MSRPEPPPQKPAPVGHIQQHKAVEKAEPVRDHIGEMEPVPDIVQLPDEKAQHKEQQKTHAAELVPELYLLCHQEQPGQQDGAHAAVEVGQSFLKIGLQPAAHIARHLTHGIQQALEGVLCGDVHAEPLGELIDAGLGGLQGRQGGHFQNGRHADGEKGKEGDAHQVQPRPLPAGEPADLVAHKYQRHKDADKKAHIVIGKHREKQGHRIEEKPFFPQKGNFSQHHQRKQGEAVQPHHIPLVSQRPGAQGIQAAENRNGKVVFPVEPSQHQGKKQPRKAQLDGHQQRKIAQQQLFRHQHAQKIQRACQIVGDEPQIIDAHADAPVVQQRLAGAQAPAEGNKKGIVLVIHIGIQHGILAKGLVAADEHHQQHSHKGKEKGQGRKIPFSFPGIR